MRQLRRLRELTGRRSTLVAERTAARNRIHSVLAMRLVVPPIKDLFRTEGIEWLRTAALDDQARQPVDSDLRLFEFVQKEIALAEEELARRGYADKSVKLLMTLPCVDMTTAAAMMAAWGDPKRFADGATLPATWDWCLRRGSRGSTVTMGRLPSKATRWLAGCSSKRRNISTRTRGLWVALAGCCERRTATWR